MTSWLSWLESKPFDGQLTLFEVFATFFGVWTGGVFGGRAIALRRLRTEYRSELQLELIPSLFEVADKIRAAHGTIDNGTFSAEGNQKDTEQERHLRDQLNQRILSLSYVERHGWKQASIVQPVDHDLLDNLCDYVANQLERRWGTRWRRFKLARRILTARSPVLSSPVIESGLSPSDGERASRP